MFEKGDRVVIIQDDRKSTLKSYQGVTGVVHDIREDRLEVAFNSFMEGHGLNGGCKDGHGWYFFNPKENELSKTQDQITIKKIGGRKNNFY